MQSTNTCKRVALESIVRDRVRGKTLLMSERYSEIFHAHVWDKIWDEEPDAQLVNVHAALFKSVGLCWFTSSTDFAAGFDMHTNFESYLDLPALYSLEARLEAWWDKDSQGDLLHFCGLETWWRQVLLWLGQYFYIFLALWEIKMHTKSK